jgi:hypothetical protein
MTKRKKDNVAIVKHIMENSEYGVIAETFVLHALSCYCTMIIESEIIQSLHSNNLWIGIAKEVKSRIDEFEKS